MAAGSSGYGGISFSQVSRDLQNVAFQFTSILSLQMQIKAALGTWRDLSRELSLAQAAAGGTRADFVQLEQAARNFALASTFSAGQTANSFYDLASAGLSVKESLQAATGVLLLAQATLADLGQASDLTASTLAQFNLQASESYRISNLFVASTNSSLSTINKLAFAFRQVGPIAAQMNLSLEQTTGMLDKLFDAGLRGEQAGTALRNLISRVTQPKGEGGDLLRSMGINSTDANGQIRPIIDILKDLQKAQISVQDAGLLVGTEGASGFQIMLQSVKDRAGKATTELEEHIKAITNTNAAYKQAVVQMNTLDGALSLMSNNFNDLRIIVGQNLAPVIGYLASELGAVTEAIRGMSQAQILGYAQTGLMIAQGYSLVKAFQAASGSAGAFRTASLQMGSSLLSLKSSVNMGFTMAQNFRLAGSAVVMAGTAVTGFVSAALPLIGVGIMIYGIYQAWTKVAEAAERARVAQVSANVIGINAAKNKKNTPNDIAALTDQTDYSGAFADTVGRTAKLANVSSDGSGAFQYMRMQAENVKEGTAGMQVLDKQIDILRNSYAKVRPKYEKMANDLASFYQQGWAGGNLGNFAQQMTGGGKLGMSSGENYVSQTLIGTGKGMFGANNDTARQYIQGVINGLNSVANAPVDQIRPALENYFNGQINTVKQINGLSNVTRNRAIERITAERDTLVKADQVQLVAFQDGAKKASAAAAKQLQDKASQNGGPNILSDAFNTIFDSVKNNTVLSDEQLKNRISELQRQRSVFAAQLAEANKSLAANDAPLALELENFVATAGGLTDQQIAAMGKLLATPNGKAVVARAVAQAHSDGGDIRGAADSILVSIMKELGLSKDQIKGSLDAIANYAIIDQAQVQRLSLQSKQRTEEALMRLAELHGDSAEVARHFSAGQSLKTQDETTQAALDFIHRTTDKGNQNVQQIGQALMQPVATSKLDGMFKAAAAKSGKDREAAIDQINTYVRSIGNGGIRDRIGNVRESVAATVEQYGSIATTDKASRAQFADQQTTKTSNTEKYVTDLLNLPTKEELFLQSQKIAVAARFALSDYFNLPLAAIDKEVVQSQIEARETFATFTTKYRKAYTDTLVKGINGATSDSQLADAFSGKLMDQILNSTGDTTVYGRKFNKEMLSTTEGLNLFIKTIQDKFASVVAGDPAARERIAAAGKQLSGMAEEVEAVYDKRVKDMQVIDLKRKETEQAIRDFQANFDSEMVVEAFKQAAATGIGDPGMVDISIDVAINARTAQINLDTESAISQMRAKYKEAFANLGVGAIYVNGQFQLAKDVAPPMPSANVSGASNDNGLQARASAFTIDSLSPAAKASVTRSATATVAELWAALVKQESGGNQKAISNKGAFGVAQLMPGTAAMMARQLGNPQLADMARTDPNVNARLGQRYLGQLLTQFKGNPVAALAAYNAGPGRSWINSGMTMDDIPKRFAKGQTSTYVKNILGGSHGAYGVSGNSIPDESTPQGLDIPQETPEEKEARFAAAKKLQDEWKAWYMRQRQIQVERVKFTTEHAQLFAANDAANAATELFNAGQGSVYDAKKASAGRRGAIADGQLNVASALAYNGATRQAVSNANRLAIVNQNIAKLQEEQADKGKALEVAYDAQIAALRTQPGTEAEVNQLLADRARMLGIINTEYERRIASAPNDVAAERAANDKTVEDLHNASNARGGNDRQSGIDGIKAGALSAVNQVQTMFELASSSMQTFVQGTTDAISALFLGSAADARTAVANMMQAIAKLIIQMLVLKAIKSVMGFSGGGTDATTTTYGTTGLLSGEADGGVVGFADGGVLRMISQLNGFAHSQIMDRNALTRGGVRAGKNPAIALFGEGHHPEAYIPMVDRRSIPVTIDNEGRAVVPLPSGQTIPVTLNMPDTKKYAQGGTSDNVIPWSAALAKRADRVSAGNSEAVSPSRGKSSAGGNVIHMGDRSYHIPLTLQYTGDATPQDSEAFAQQTAKRIMEMMDSRDGEQQRQAIRSNRGLLSSQHGITK